MTTALRPNETPDLHDGGYDGIAPEMPRRRRDRDAASGISAAELLARFSEAGFDAPVSGGRRAARVNGTGAFGPAVERIETPADDAPAPASDGDTGSGDSLVTRDLPAGVTQRSALGLVKGTSDTGAFGTRPRAVVATVSATLVGATAVMGVVSTLASPDQGPDDQARGVGLTGADNAATMKLSVPAAGSHNGGTDGAGTSEAATSMTAGLQHVTSSVPQAFEQADVARIAAVAQKEAGERAAHSRAEAAKSRAERAGDGAGDGAGSSASTRSGRASSGDGKGTGTVSGDAVTDFSGSSSGLQALSAAKSKLGKPYQWGATGPNAFDCSGLMQWAFEQVGVDLPRTSSAQAQADGKSVDRDELKPGDLVFFYSPVSHVGIYAGNGKVLHASTSGEPVKYSNVDDMPFNSALRVS